MGCGFFAALLPSYPDLSLASDLTIYHERFFMNPYSPPALVINAKDRSSIELWQVIPVLVLLAPPVANFLCLRLDPYLGVSCFALIFGTACVLATRSSLNTTALIVAAIWSMVVWGMCAPSLALLRLELLGPNRYFLGSFGETLGLHQDRLMFLPLWPVLQMLCLLTACLYYKILNLFR